MPCQKLFLSAVFVSLIADGLTDVLAASTIDANVVATFKVKNDQKNASGEQVEADDFHVVITGLFDATFKNEPTLDGGNFKKHSTNADANTSTTSIDFIRGTVADGGKPVAFGDKNTFKITIKAKKNGQTVKQAYWTDATGNKIADVKVPNFEVKGDPVYTLIDAFDQPLGIRNLQFLVNVPEISVDNLDPGSTSGFGPVLPDFVLPADGSVDLSVPGSLDPGNYLYAQGATFDVTTGLETGEFIHGHQSPIPEPQSILLVSCGALLLGGVIRVGLLHVQSAHG